VLCFALAARGLRSSQASARLSFNTWLIDMALGFMISAPVYWMFTKFLGINLPGLTESGWL